MLHEANMFELTHYCKYTECTVNLAQVCPVSHSDNVRKDWKRVHGSKMRQRFGLFFMTFQHLGLIQWRMWILNSMIFQDSCAPWRLHSLSHIMDTFFMPPPLIAISHAVMFFWVLCASQKIC